jgi:acyl CoA:acetate/3-ketoacid CoA transferase beta subunit
LGARLAAATFEPSLLLTNGEALLVTGSGDRPGDVEGWLPFPAVFDMAWSGRRHVLMGAAQLDAFGNQNISCIGDWRRPTRQLLGSRGAPGNTVNHPTSYWVPNHSPRVFVDHVDFVSGVGYDRARAGGPTATRFHHLHQVVTNLAVLDFGSPDRRMRLVSLHPGVSLANVRAATGFPLVVPDDVPETRQPSGAELRLIREVLDPRGTRENDID